MLSVCKAKEMHCHDMSDIARVHFVRILFLQNQPNEVRVLSVSGQFATQKTRQRKTRIAPLKVKSPL